VRNDASPVRWASLPELGFSRILKAMEVHFTAETEKKLRELAAHSKSGTADELVREVVEGYLDELAQTREMLSDRYDNLKSGRMRPIPEEVVAHFREKSAAARRSVSSS
jgi:predicted DNA-binding protein